MKRRKLNGSNRQGCSMADLPEDVLYEIMLKLPIRSIVMSKSVCKTWRDLISDPRFAKQHLARAKPSLLLRDRHRSRFSRALYMVESLDDYCVCYSSEKERCRRAMKVQSKLKIPIRNKDLFLGQVQGDIADFVFCTDGRGCKRKNSMIVYPNSLGKYVFTHVSSCNGLLCLSSIYDSRIIVCNPITGEYIQIPHYTHNIPSFGSVLMGFSPKSNQYKVLCVPIHTDLRRYTIGQIQTLGTRVWRKVDLSKFPPRRKDQCVCLDGAQHWVCLGNDKSPSPCIARFDLDEECFRSPFPLLNFPDDSESSIITTVRLLGDRLCVYVEYNFGFGIENRIDIWAMEEYGVAESWKKMVSINYIIGISICEVISIYGYHNPSSFMAGEFIFLDEYNTMIYCDRRGEYCFKHIKSRGIISEFDAIVHVPSFSSLKDMVGATNTEVCNVYSGCGKIRFMEENYPVYLNCKKNH